MITDVELFDNENKDVKDIVKTYRIYRYFYRNSTVRSSIFLQAYVLAYVLGNRHEH